jgi:kynurenine formamidase
MANRTPPTVEEFGEFPNRLSNWGRWGADDVLGTLNHITPDSRRYAAALVRAGRSVSLALPIDAEPRAGFPSGFQHQLEVGEKHSMEEITMSFHGMAMTHLDAMSHIFTAPGGQIYNGRPASSVTPEGAASGDVYAYADGIVTRGVLYDVPAFRGSPHVTLDAPVHGWELRDIAAAHGVEPRAGDAVVVRCGAAAFYAAQPETGFENYGSMPGLHASALEYLHETDAALLVWDLLDAGDQGYPATFAMGDTMQSVPLHEIAIPYMGMPLLDNADLEALSQTCAELQRWEFLLVVAPLPIRNGTGSPVNPVAIF